MGYQSSSVQNAACRSTNPGLSSSFVGGIKQIEMRYLREAIAQYVYVVLIILGPIYPPRCIPRGSMFAGTSLR